MVKKVQKKPVASAAEPLKKKIKRQNTMEVTAIEGKALVTALDKQNKKKDQEKKKVIAEVVTAATSKGPKKAAKTVKSAKPAKSADKKKSKKVVKKAPKATKADSPKKSSKKPATPVPAPAPKKSARAIPKKVPATVAAKVETADDKKKKVIPPAPAPLTASGAVSMYEAYTHSCTVARAQADIDSCKSIASTEVIKNEKLGMQIIKKSLKGVAKPDDSTKGKILRTKTGDKLAAGMIDIVFCCDTTSSMSSYLTQCKSTVNAIIKHILDKTQGEGISVKFAFVAYRDHPPQDHTYLTCSYDFTTDDEIKEFIESLTAYGGGDYPEAVMDGLYVSAKHMSWRDSTHIPSLRYIFHIADAPPHGAEYSTSGFASFGAKNCPCDMDINKISHIINMKQIHYRFISTDNMSGTKKMAEIFKEKMTNYEECSITNAADMDIHISDMIIRELLPDMAEEDM